MSLESLASICTMLGVGVALYGTARAGAHRLRDDLRAEISATRDDLRAEISALRADLKADVARLDDHVATLDDRVYALAAGLRPLVDQARATGPVA